jgi:hypothetical protein
VLLVSIIFPRFLNKSVEVVATLHVARFTPVPHRNSCVFQHALFHNFQDKHFFVDLVRGSLLDRATLEKALKMRLPTPVANEEPVARDGKEDGSK